MSKLSLKSLVKNENSLFGRVVTNPSGIFALSIVSIFTLVAIFSPWIAPYDPVKLDFNALSAMPSLHHLMGTDNLGRDVFSRIVIGSRTTLSGAVLAMVIAASVGTILGLIAGYLGGFWESITNWLANVIQALPGLVVLLAAASVLGSGVYIAMTIFGFILSPSFYRLTYVTVKAVKNELYVDAARVSGLSDFRIISRHVLGVVRAPIIIQAGIVSSIAIALQSGLQFLGFGGVDTISWGASLTEAFGRIYQQPMLLIWPSVCIALFMISLVVLANTLRDEIQRVGARVRMSTSQSLSEHVKTEADEETIVHAEPNRKGTQLLDVKNLEIGYLQSDGKYKVVVHDANLSINKGEVVGLVGESGSGKTQTALAILGLLPAGGTILDGHLNFDGNDLRTVSPKMYESIRGKRISYIPQEPMSNLDPSFTIGSQLTEPLRQVLGMSKEDAKKKALDLLARVGMPNPQKTFNSYPHEVSGGQAQRVLIAGALSCDPDLIIADEPTTALDVTIQAEILDVIRDMQKQTGVAVLLVTHNFGVVADLADRVAVMQYGRIVEVGSVIDIFENARHPYTKELLGAILDETGPSRSEYVAKGSN